MEDDQLKDQDGQLQGWLGVLNRVGIPTPLPAGYGSVVLKEKCTSEELQNTSTGRVGPFRTCMTLLYFF